MFDFGDTQLLIGAGDRATATGAAIMNHRHHQHPDGKAREHERTYKAAGGCGRAAERERGALERL